jgi:uncharacterized protein
MDITPAVPENRMLIDSYGPGRFQVRGVAYQGPVIVFPTHVVPWSLTRAADVSLDALSLVQQESPPIEVLLLGTGERMEMIPSALRDTIRNAGLSMDIMKTGAACRTFNVLMIEGRRAAAALIPE